MGMMAFLPTLPFYLEERFGIDDPAALRAWTGAIFGAAPLSAAIAGPMWGALGDRYGRKPMALRALLGISLVTGLMPSNSSARMAAWIGASSPYCLMSSFAER